jgi:hypothetical protein
MIHNLVGDQVWKTSINIGRPTFYPDRPDTMRHWREFHDWVEECPMPIGVSSAYGFVRRQLNESEGYGGGGFAYHFWFLNEEDATTFMSLWGGEVVDV